MVLALQSLSPHSNHSLLIATWMVHAVWVWTVKPCWCNRRHRRCILATIMAEQEYWGMPGWRFAFIMIASLSLLIGLLVFLFVVDPRRTSFISSGAHVETERSHLVTKGSLPPPSVWSDSWLAMRSVMRVQTFQIIVLQGIVGSLPWTAIVFFTMWFELIGFDHKSSAALNSLFAIGCATGSLLVREQLVCVCHYLFFMGLTISWCATCANNPMFAEVVPSKHRTMIYAFDRAFEGSFSSFAAPAVGMLTEKIYGYDSKFVSLVNGSPQGAFALSRGLLIMMVIPFGLCCLFYSPLYFVFKHDRDNAKMASRKEQELI
uniref:Major facilitator superfamily (MFS) profile domain-containing protein n=1 Tax=Ananas comosus var. bracteatus TaxID=296719 RepID=A0A6V7NJ15_ANACO|nr:unnamed protein product [Ananas comosus var. bracteatus]